MSLVDRVDRFDWTTTVSGRTIRDIQKAATAEARRFGVAGPLHYDIRARVIISNADGRESIVDYEATVSMQDGLLDSPEEETDA